nr:MAG TPA: hypothetical protein [Caudoviricetes sp.]
MLGRLKNGVLIRESFHSVIARGFSPLKGRTMGQCSTLPSELNI